MNYFNGGFFFGNEGNVFPGVVVIFQGEFQTSLANSTDRLLGPVKALGRFRTRNLTGLSPANSAVQVH